MSETTDKPLWTFEGNLDTLDEVASRVQAGVQSGGPFVLWLVGPMGAGKTTLTSVILHRLGLDERVPVLSPTYTFLNEYEIGSKWFAHVDLYRARAPFSLEDLGLADARPFYGMFVEWPENIPFDPVFAPTHRLTIDYVPGGQARRYQFSLEAP